MELQDCKLFVGIDPSYIGSDASSYGCISIINDVGIIDVIRMDEEPLHVFERFKKAIENNACTDNAPFVCLEHVWGRPTDTSKRAFKFGGGFYSVLFMVKLLRLPYVLTVPQLWLKYYGLKRHKEESQHKWKKRLYEKCREIYPNYKYTQQCADGILIGHYAMKHIKHDKFSIK